MIVRFLYFVLMICGFLVLMGAAFLNPAADLGMVVGGVVAALTGCGNFFYLLGKQDGIRAGVDAAQAAHKLNNTLRTYDGRLK